MRIAKYTQYICQENEYNKCVEVSSMHGILNIQCKNMCFNESDIKCETIIKDNNQNKGVTVKCEGNEYPFILAGNCDYIYLAEILFEQNQNKNY